MDWKELVATQKQLDEKIENRHGLQNKVLFQEKMLALLVEVGELANETRCFKFWSNKPSSQNDVVLAEYVDGLHFILSIGLEKNLVPLPFHSTDNKFSLTQQFNQVFEKIIIFQQQPDEEAYQQLCNCYLQLGEKLKFAERDIQNAYYQKNRINHQRQEQGY